VTAPLTDLIESSDLNGLLRHVEGLVSDRDWPGMVEMRDRCLEAVERGKQLWGVAQFVEYRLALDAAPAFAGKVVREGAGRFTLGPLWEVAASTHTWRELEPHVLDARLRALVAAERVIRGDEVPAGEEDRTVLDVPLRLQPWEPAYQVAAYRGDKADFPADLPPDLAWLELPERPSRVEGVEGVDALLNLVHPWTEQSNGRAEAVAVEGTAAEAIRALGPHRARLAEVPFSVALSAMAWTGASGGAYGRRRGTPVGRSLAWWTVATLLGIEDGDPTPEELGEEGPGLRWYQWDPGDRIGGWGFHLAVEDPVDRLAFAISAVDAL
jgi:hypothetical protein